MSQPRTLQEMIANNEKPKSVLDSMFADTVLIQANEMANKAYIAKNHYTPYMVQNKLHEEDMPVATMVHCEKDYVVVICPYCPLTHLHTMANRNPFQHCFGSSHCCKGDYKFGELLTGATIKDILSSKSKTLASKAVYRKKLKQTKTTQ